MDRINIKALKKLPVHKCPPSYHYSRHLGMGCAGDPPGYPTYFLQSVYTSHGNSPRKGATAVIVHEGVAYVLHSSKDYDTAIARVKVQARKEGKTLIWEEQCKLEREAHDALIKRRIERIYNPLPEDHPRMEAWIRDTYRHHRGCYKHPTEMEYGKRKLVTRGVDYRHVMFRDDERFSDEWREKERARIEQENKELDRLWAEVSVIENHSAVVIVRRFLPNHEPRVDLVENPPKEIEGHWWETEEEQPTPETCKPRNNGPHNRSWCQWCGSKAEEPAEAVA